MFACLVEAARIERDASSTGGDDTAPATRLVAIAQVFSPRIERADDAVVCDVMGLERLFGTYRTIAEELRREAADRGTAVRVAVASTRTAARLLAYGRVGLTVVEAGEEREALAALPLSVLRRMVLADVPRVPSEPPRPARFYRTSPMEEIARTVGPPLRGGRSFRSSQIRSRVNVLSGSRSSSCLERYEEIFATLSRWGLKTLGDLAALPTDDLSSRLGQEGVALQRLAGGDDEAPLVPLQPDERFESQLELEWPIEGLEPLSFVLGRLLDPVCGHLERRGRAAAAISLELRLVTRDTHVRRLQLPAPIRDSRVLRTLVLLDLESHPPPAGIDVVAVRIEPTPGRVLQYSLLERAQPAPEQMSTLLARLGALMGQDRCGAPVVLDTFRPGAFTMAPFAADQSSRSRQVAQEPVAGAPPVALRRYREPMAVRVAVEQNRPVRLIADRVGIMAGRIETSAGPWRTSGEWWTDGWRRDQWDVALEDGTVCRIFQDRATKGWFLEGVID